MNRHLPAFFAWMAAASVPFSAAGLLPLVLGRATRLVRFLPSSPKVYEGSLRLGRTTTTDDETGQTLTEHAGPLPEAPAVLEAATSLVGVQLQIPPIYSAKRVAGRRLYEMARKGEAVTAAAAEIEVFHFELTSTDRPELYHFRVGVSAGTYVRGLARDLGARLGCGGLLAGLTRTEIGPLRLADARRLPDDPTGSDWVRAGLIPLEAMPLLPPPTTLADTEQARRFRLGGVVRPAPPEARGRVRVLSPDGALLGIAEEREGALHPSVVLAAASAR